MISNPDMPWNWYLLGRNRFVYSSRMQEIAIRRVRNFRANFYVNFSTKIMRILQFSTELCDDLIRALVRPITTATSISGSNDVYLGSS